MLSDDQFLIDFLAVVRLAYRKDPEKTFLMSTIARNVGLIKDPPLLASDVFGREHLSLFFLNQPIGYYRRFLSMSRELDTMSGLGRRKKGALAKALSEGGEEWNAFQSVKSKKKMRDVLKLVHPPPPSEELRGIWGWVVGRGTSSNPLIQSYESFMKWKDSSFERALEIALETPLPWSVVRSNISLEAILNRLSEKDLFKLFANTMSPFDVLAQLSTVVRTLGEDVAIDLLREKLKERVAAYSLARAVLGLSAQGYGKVSRWLFWNALLEKSERLYDILGFDEDEVVLLLDMSDQAFKRHKILAEMGLFLRPKGTIYLFSKSEDSLMLDDEVLSSTEAGLEFWTALYSEELLPLGEKPGTLDAMEEFSAKYASKDKVLVVLTSEANEMNSIPALNYVNNLDKWKSVVVVGLGGDDPLPMSYGNLISVKGRSPDALIASLRMLKLMESEGSFDLKNFEKASEIGT
ncbi:hypothetical protein IPA_07665 [Ignicoccus pacificus DSM 13166]|uniref:Uncharacterized protein n=1 Tax=Ignicoccus pacificus DSM 13166 TaxID=940294 RepID=A0A977KBN0_9CREN|nr:hypothetical protein IPA_07665 [Ignicoccus pacificus DSM 13166]